jgi:hypothetical protein
VSAVTRRPFGMLIIFPELTDGDSATVTGLPEPGVITEALHLYQALGHPDTAQLRRRLAEAARLTPGRR